MQINQNYPNNPYGAQIPYPQSYGYNPYANMPPRFAPTVQPVQAPQPAQQPVMQQPSGLAGRFVQSADEILLIIRMLEQRRFLTTCVQKKMQI